MKSILVVSMMAVLGTSAGAQTSAPQAKDPVSSGLRDIQPGRQKNTIAAVEAMPAEKFSFKPTAEQKTFAQLVVHMIEANYLLCSKAAGIAKPNAEEAKDSDSKEKLVATLRSSFDFCSETLAKMDDSKLSEMTEGFGGKQVTHAWFSLVLASNWADHYAETAMYLRLNGIVPPSAKK